MRDLVRAEFLKIRTTRTAYGLLAGLLGLTALALSVELSNSGIAEQPVALADLLVRIALAFQLLLFVLVLSLRSFTDEFRHGSIVPTLLTNPDRRSVLVAKVVVTATAGVCFAAAAYGMALAIGVVWLAAIGGSATLTPGAVAMLLGKGALVAALWAALGVGLGVVIRRQVAAIVGALVWIFVAENLVVARLPDVGRYLPLSATGSLAGAPGFQLGALAGGLVLAGWAAAALAAGGVLMSRRDIA